MPLIQTRQISACPKCGAKVIEQDWMTVGKSPSGTRHVRPLPSGGNCDKCGVKREPLWELRDGRLVSTQELDRIKD